MKTPSRVISHELLPCQSNPFGSLVRIFLCQVPSEWFDNAELTTNLKTKSIVVIINLFGIKTQRRTMDRGVASAGLIASFLSANVGLQ